MSPTLLKENGPFKTDNVKQLSKSFNIAVLHNLSLDEDELNNIEIKHSTKLNPIDLPLDIFLDLFYNTHSKYFSIKKANAHNDLITFNKQSYSSNNHNKIRFSLNDQLLHTYSLHHNIDVENINPLNKIKLNKETFILQSLSKMYGTQITLDWDQVIHSLLENNYIVRSSNALSVATVSFEVTANVFSKSLNVWSSVVFTYRTKLNGFSNVCEGNNNLNEVIKSYNCSEQSSKPFYSSVYNKKFISDHDYEIESDNGINHGKDSHSDSDSLEQEPEQEPEPEPEPKKSEVKKIEKPKKHHLETLKELEDEDLPDLDDNSIIYTINSELLDKINNVKNQSDESVCTWLK